MQKLSQVDTKIASRKDLMLKQLKTKKCLFFQWNLMFFSTFENRISGTESSQNQLKNCIQDSMAQKNGFMPIKSPQKQPKRSLRHSKTPPRFPYDVPRRPKTPPRCSPDAFKALPGPPKRPPRPLQDASKTVQDASKDALDRPRRPKMPPNLHQSLLDLDS